MTGKVIRYLVVFIVLLTAACLVISWYYADKVKGLVVTEINRHLDAPASVKKIDFSLFENFPFASVVFEQVLIKEKSGFQDTLFYAEKVAFLVGYAQLFGKNYSVKQIVINQAVAKVKTDSKGNNNYEIWKKNDESPGQINRFRLEQLLVNNTRIHYDNRLKKIGFHTFAEKGKLSGDFSDQVFVLESKTELLIYHFYAEGISYLRNRKAELLLDMKIDQPGRTYTIQKSDLVLDGLHLLVKGDLHTEKEGTMANLRVSSPGSGPQELLSLLRLNETARRDEFNYKGSVSFDMQVKGLISKKTSPLVEVNFGATNVTITPKGRGASLHKVNFKGRYTSQKSQANQVSWLSIQQLHAVLNDQPLQGDLEVTDFENPYLRMKFTGMVDLEKFSRIFKPDTIEQLSGVIDADISFAGKIGDLRSYRASGIMTISGMNISLKQKPVGLTAFNGTFALKDNDVEMKSCTGKIGQSDISIDGTCSNLFSYLMLPEQNLKIKASLISENMNLDEILDKRKGKQEPDSMFRFHFSEGVSADVNINIGHLYYKKFQSRNITGNIKLENQVLTGQELNFSSMEGNILLKGTINTVREDSILILAEANFKKINITKLFYEMGNFGQDIIEDKNLKGMVTAEVQFASTWSAGLICNTKKLYALGDIIIENGELTDFAPTKALSKYVKGADLNNIKFSTLKNKVEIKNRTIHFATMEVRSNAMDLTASGTHTFDNMVDYKIKLSLSQLLGKKVKEQNTEFGQIEDDGQGHTNLFLRMSGPMKNPKFTWDNKSVEEKIVQDIKTEKQNLKNVLNKEFGWFKKDTALVKKKEGPYKEEEIQVDYGDEIEEK